MKTYLASAGLLALGLATPAIAADLPARPGLPVKARPASPVLPPDWSGFYLGAHGGHGWGRNQFSEPVFGPDDTIGFIGGINSRGWVFGGHAGYNWQYGRMVAGLEVDFSAANIKGSSAPVTLSGLEGTSTEAQHDRVKYLGSARARLGALPIDSVLLYGTAGLAWQRLEHTQRVDELDSDGIGSTRVSTDAIDRFGWVAGAGAEARLSGSNWFGRVEYLHYDFGTSERSHEIQSLNSIVLVEIRATSGRQTIDIVRAGLSYKFAPTPGTAVAAMAAAYPVKAPVAGASASGWSGFYLGAHGGYGWGKHPSSQTVSGPGDTSGILGSIHARGAVFGGHAGYNWQYGGMVAGLEADFSAANIRGSTSLTLSTTDLTTTSGVEERTKYLGSARARLGVPPTDNVLLYGTAGLGWQRLERTRRFDELNSDGLAFSEAFTEAIDRFGWVAGAGVEAALFGSQWIGRIEYLHYDFGRSEQFDDRLVDNGDVAFERRRTSGRQTVDIVRAGLSYKFAPVAGTAVSAMAAGYPVKGPPAPGATAFGWSGFYLGVHGGYGWGNNPFSEPVTGPDGATGTIGGIDSRGTVIGGHAGYNWQYGRIVAGFELDFSATDIKGSTSTILSNGDDSVIETRQDRVAYLGSTRARLGVLPIDSAVLYATGGLGWQRLERTNGFRGITTTPSTITVSTSTGTQPIDRFGWVVGAGAEAKLFGSNWLGRIEYLHYHFGRSDRSHETETAGGVVTSEQVETSGRQTINIIRAGLSYKFGPL